MDKQARRFFIALPVDDEKLIQSLKGVFEYLKKNESFFKIVPFENYHITLKFFGELETENADLLIKTFLSLNPLKKAAYKIEGIGSFPSSRNPSVIWAGLKCDQKSINEILHSVETLASSLGFSPENKKFIPHLTLARVKKEKKVPQDLKYFLDHEKYTFLESSVFRELVLFESILKSSGPEYKKIEVMNLI